MSTVVTGYHSALGQLLRTPDILFPTTIPGHGTFSPNHNECIAYDPVVTKAGHVRRLTILHNLDFLSTPDKSRISITSALIDDLVFSLPLATYGADRKPYCHSHAALRYIKDGF